MFESPDSPAAADAGFPPLFDVYDELLVPLIFEPYADDVVRRLADVRAGSLIEIAAGTGAVTRKLAASLPAEISITATDLVQPMLDRAERVGTTRPVTWQQANVFELPFEDESFDVAVCQFGVMFFDPKADAFAEVRRVLRPGGRFVFSVWAGLDDNDFAATVAGALKQAFPENPPSFIERTPHGHHDPDAIAAALKAGGLEMPPAVEELAFTVRGESAAQVATAYCAGTPARNEVEPRGPGSLAQAIAVSTAALEERFGTHDIEGRISASVFTTSR